MQWGIDLGSEHERYLAEKVFKGPVILYNYPKDIKAFYMRLNDDEKTVAAMDVLVPGVCTPHRLLAHCQRAPLSCLHPCRLSDPESSLNWNIALMSGKMDWRHMQVGELIGGSQREEREDVLARRIGEMGLPLEQYSWYLDLRRFGSVPHAGFGLGFERLVLFTTGMENIRDVIPFPRYPGKIL